MKLIVANMSYRLRDFIKKYQFTSKVMVINKMCNVKTIKEIVDVIIPFGKVENNGLISATQVHLEELLMTINVNKIIYSNPKAENELTNIANKYGVKLEYLDLNAHDVTRTL